MLIRGTLKLKRKTKNMVQYEAANQHGAVGILYVHQSSLPTNAPAFAAVRFKLDDSGHLENFSNFLADRVRENKDGVVTVGKIWTTWAEHHGVSRDQDEIGGVGLSQIPDMFRDHFNAGEQTRARVDGRVQRCWRGYTITR